MAVDFGSIGFGTSKFLTLDVQFLLLVASYLVADVGDHSEHMSHSLPHRIVGMVCYVLLTPQFITFESAVWELVKFT